MKKITILALHLSTGGTEKTIATLSNILVKKYKVEIIANYQIQENPAFYIDKNVNIKYLMPTLKPNQQEFKLALKHFKIITVIKEGIKAIRILYLRRALMIKAIKKLDSDIVISTRYIYNKLLGKYGNKNVIKIAQEHNNNGNKKYVNKVLKSLKNIDYLIPVSKQLTDIYKEKLTNKKTKCLYIPHCLEIYTNTVSDLKGKNIISIGRLSKEKGFLDLIDVFKLVSMKNDDWHLNIIGDGTQKDAIITKIKEKNLENKVSLLGFKTQKELAEIFLQSSIYAMTSFYESFGLVLIEAESFGIPLLAFDSAEGPKEIIENGQNGFLIGNRNKEEMANKINELICNEELRNKMGQEAREKSKAYKMENVEKIWYDFIEKL